MPTIPNFTETLDKLKELHKRKNDDYSGNKGEFFNFQFCDYVSSLFDNARDKVYAVFVAVKLARLAVILSSKEVMNESIEDSFDDMITYATIWKCDYMARKPKTSYTNEQLGLLQNQPDKYIPWEGRYGAANEKPNQNR